nr:uncharacterized protein LOC129381368 [Dermacentor andersoni]
MTHCSQQPQSLALGTTCPSHWLASIGLHVTFEQKFGVHRLPAARGGATSSEAACTKMTSRLDQPMICNVQHAQRMSKKSLGDPCTPTGLCPGPSECKESLHCDPDQRACLPFPIPPTGVSRNYNDTDSSSRPEPYK